MSFQRLSIITHMIFLSKTMLERWDLKARRIFSQILARPFKKCLKIFLPALKISRKILRNILSKILNKKLLNMF